MTMTISCPDFQIDPSKIDVSAYAPRPPVFRHEPLKVAEDTFLIRQTSGEGEAPIFAYINSLVITGTEPVIVDTGMVNNRKEWLNDVFSLVDPRTCAGSSSPTTTTTTPATSPKSSPSAPTLP